MPISVQCQYCSEAYRVRDENAGKRFNCKACGETIAVPAARSRRPSTRRNPARRRPTVDEYDDYDDDYDSYEDDYRPRRSSPKKKKKRKKRKRRESVGGYGNGIPGAFWGCLGLLIPLVLLNLLALGIGAALIAQRPREAMGGAIAAMSMLGLVFNGLSFLCILIPSRITWYIVRGVLVLSIIGVVLRGLGCIGLLMRGDVAGFLLSGLLDVMVPGGCVFGIYILLGKDDTREFYGFRY